VTGGKTTFPKGSVSGKSGGRNRRGTDLETAVKSSGGTDVVSNV